MDDNGSYEPPAMDDWKLIIEYPPGPTAPLLPPPHDAPLPLPPPGMAADGANGGNRPKPKIYWRARFEEENVSARILPETPMWGAERELLDMDRETEEYVLDPPPTKSRGGMDGGEKKSRRSSRMIDNTDVITRDNDRDDKRRRRRKRRSMLEPGPADDGRRQSPSYGGGP